MKYFLSTATGIGMLAFALPGFAQSSIEKFERQIQAIQQQTRQRVNPDIPPDQRAGVDYGGYLSLNALAIDDEQQNTHLLFQPDLVGYFRLNLDGVHEFFIRGRATYREFYQDNSFDSRGSEGLAVLEQAYYRFDLARYLAGQGKPTENNDFNITGGRQFVFWGNGLVLGQFVDGISSDITFGNLGFTLLGGVTVPQLTVDWDASRCSFDDHTDRGFFGGMASVQMGSHKPFIYGLIQRDYNDDDPLVTGGITTRFKYDSWYVGAGSNGSFGDHWLYGVEAVYEGGETLSNSFTLNAAVPPNAVQADQTHENISAGAADLHLDYMVADVRRSRFSGEVILATGATDRLASSSSTFGGIESGSTDHAFNALGLLNTGLAFAPQVTNLTAFRMGASTFPFTSMKRLQVGADFFVFGKFNTKAPVDEPTTNDWYLGVEPDIYMNWQITSDISLAVRYGIFFPGSAIIQDEHPRNFFFAGLTFSF